MRRERVLIQPFYAQSPTKPQILTHAENTGGSFRSIHTTRQTRSPWLSIAIGRTLTEGETLGSHAGRKRESFGRKRECMACSEPNREAPELRDSGEKRNRGTPSRHPRKILDSPPL